MDLINEQHSDVMVVRVNGRLDAAGAPSLETHAKAVITGGQLKVLLDMAGVEYISSAGLRSLLVLAKSAKAAGGKLVLCCLAPAVKEVMTISGFDSILPLATDREAAVGLFA